jgi:hypothetical protein
MESLNFEQFIPVYPEDNEVDIQRIIANKREFLEVAGTITEPKPLRGQYYKHQKALLRYMRYHDRMLVVHETGTGKTCSLVAISEYYRQNGGINQVYILEKGDTTKEEFKKQIVCSCTSEDAGFITAKNTNPFSTERTRKGLLTRSIHNAGYNVMTYGDFARRIKEQQLTDEEIEKQYSGCLFFVDEAHNLSEDRSAIRKQSRVTGEEVDKDEKEEEEFYYDVLFKVFHIVKRSKIVLATATPMINKVDELPKLMNLLLPLDSQMPTSWDYDKVTLSQLEPFFRGKVSYVRGLDTGAVVEEQGELIDYTHKPFIFAAENQQVSFVTAKVSLEGKVLEEPAQPKVITESKIYKSQSKVVKLPMSDFQTEAYMKTYEQDLKDISKKKTENFRYTERNAAFAVFPNGCAGGDFSKAGNRCAGRYIIPETGIKKGYKLTPEMKDAVEDPETLKILSSKYSFILDNELDPKNVGNVFIYSDIKTGSGAILLGKILEAYGFEKYSESGSVFTSKEKTRVSICTTDVETKEIRKTFPKKRRYGLIGTDNDSLLELFNSPDNKDGEYIKIMIGTPNSRDGINLYNVRRGYLVGPTWTPSGIHQALSRFLRSTSHEDLIKDEQRRLTNENKDPSNAKVAVKIYKLASTLNNGDENTVDIELYTQVEEKDIKIRRMMRFLKQCAFDCPIHYKRNVRSTDTDNTPMCDYTSCKYTCYSSNIEESQIDGLLSSLQNKENSDLDDSTFDILYSEEIVEECRSEIVKLMRKHSSLLISDLYEELGSVYKKTYIVQAINNIVTQKYQVLDRFGFPCYINTNGYIIYTQTYIPSDIKDDNSDLSYYKDMMVGIVKENFEYIINLSGKEELESIIEKAKSLPDPSNKDYKEFSGLIDQLTDSKKQDIIEESLEKIVKRKETDFDKAIKEKFAGFIYIINEPLTDINEIKKRLESIIKKRGRVRKEDTKPFFNDIKLRGEELFNTVINGQKPERVVIHNFSSQKSDISSYNITSSARTPNYEIRILKSSENIGWRNVNKYEYQPYSSIISESFMELFERCFKNYNSCGTIGSDKSFRIIEKTDESKLNDPRSVNRGRICNSILKEAAILILVELDFVPDDVKSVIIPEKTKEDMLNYLKGKIDITKVDKLSKEQLINFIKWQRSERSVKNMCIDIEKIFDTQQRLIKLY